MENNQPLISVIMNCYNSDSYLKEAIDSVIDQTYQNWEIIFWDNQSTDKSADVVKSYNDSRIKYFYAPFFTQLGEARNFAIEKCSGEWIGFLDCDDIWRKDKLTLCIKRLKSSNNIEKISLIYSKALIIDRKSKIISKSDRLYSGYIHDKLLREGDFIVFSSIIVKKDILNKYGNVNEKLNYCEDYDLLLKISKGHQVIGITEYLTSYRMHGKNITSTKLYENYVETIQFFEDYMDKNKLDRSTIVSVYLNNSYRTAAVLSRLVKKLELNSLFNILFKYSKYVLLSPIGIIYKKLFCKNL
jgi:glycosyltransferase involved in cell wall biosynthesis